MKEKKEKKKKYDFSKFMAMSKLIGLIACLFVFAIVIYSMVEMHITGDLSNLSQLIISSFSFAGIYTGFYLTMAKAEHIDAERQRLKDELNELRNKYEIDPKEIIEAKKEALDKLSDKYTCVLTNKDDNEY